MTALGAISLCGIMAAWCIVLSSKILQLAPALSACRTLLGAIALLHAAAVQQQVSLTRPCLALMLGIPVCHIVLLWSAGIWKKRWRSCLSCAGAIHERRGPPRQHMLQADEYLGLSGTWHPCVLC